MSVKFFAKYGIFPYISVVFTGDIGHRLGTAAISRRHWNDNGWSPFWYRSTMGYSTQKLGLMVRSRNLDKPRQTTMFRAPDRGVLCPRINLCEPATNTGGLFRLYWSIKTSTLVAFSNFCIENNALFDYLYDATKRVEYIWQSSAIDECAEWCSVYPLHETIKLFHMLRTLGDGDLDFLLALKFLINQSISQRNTILARILPSFCYWGTSTSHFLL